MPKKTICSWPKIQRESSADPLFKKGQSGNPSGKPPGTRNKTTMLAEKLMQDDARDIVRVVLEAAKGGDMTAARLILERIFPVRKGRPSISICQLCAPLRTLRQR